MIVSPIKRPLMAVLFAATQLVLIPAQATEIMPPFTNAPNGVWTAPGGNNPQLSVNTVSGGYQGRADVLGINTLLSNTPGTYGGQIPVTGGVDSQLTAWLYIPQEWETSANGNGDGPVVSTQMMGIMPIPDPDNPGQYFDFVYYPAIGFSNDNQSGAGELRVWDPTLPIVDGTQSYDCNVLQISCWVDLTTPFKYDEWIKLTIDYTVQNNTVFKVNDVEVYGYANDLALLYPFFDPPDNTPIPGFGFSIAQISALVSDVAYVAYWSSIPEPSSLSLIGLGLVIIGLSKNRRRNTDNGVG